MKIKSEKQCLIIGEIGQEKKILTNKDFYKKVEISLKELGLTKNDIIIISSNNLTNISNIIRQASNNISPLKKDKNSNSKDKLVDIINNNYNEDFYLYSLNNRYEIYKQQFESIFKSQVKDKTFFLPTFIIDFI